MKKILSLIIAFSFASSCFAATTGNVAKRIIFKGLNTRGGPVSLDDGESPNCMNVHTSLFGTLIKRNGYTNESGTHQHISTSPGIIRGIFNYDYDDSTSYLVSIIDGNFYKMDALDGVWDPIGSSYSNLHVQAYPYGFSDDIAEFVNFDGDLIMTTWSRNYGIAWSGGNSLTHVQLMPRGKHIIKAYNRLFVGNVTISNSGYGGTDTDYPLRIYYSEAGSYTDWGDGADYSVYDESLNFETLDAGSGDVCMGFGFMKGRLFGFTKRAVNLISDVGGSYPIIVTRRLDSVGCGAPRSIKTVNVPGLGESLIWLTDDRRIVAWDGSTLKYISEKIDTTNYEAPLSCDKIDTEKYVYSHAVVYEDRGWYVLFVPTGDYVNYAIVYDYKTDTVWTFDNMNFLSSALVPTALGNKVYTGDYEGYIYKFDDGRSDDGDAINAYWQSRRWDFGFLPLLKKGSEAQISTRAIGTYYLDFQDRYNWSSSWSAKQHLLMSTSDAWLLGDLLPAILGAPGAVTNQVDIPYDYNLYQMRIGSNSDDPPFEVYSLDMIVRTTTVAE